MVNTKTILLVLVGAAFVGRGIYLAIYKQCTSCGKRSKQYTKCSVCSTAFCSLCGPALEEHTKEHLEAPANEEPEAEEPVEEEYTQETTEQIKEGENDKEL